MINLHIRRLAVVYTIVQAAPAPSQMSYLAGHIPEGQGKCYVDEGDVLSCMFSVHVSMVCLCVQHWVHYCGIMKTEEHLACYNVHPSTEGLLEVQLLH